MSDDIKYTEVDEIEKVSPADEEDEDEYEEVCMMCHRPESKAGRMVHMPGNVCICDDCMHRTMDMVNDNWLSLSARCLGRPLLLTKSLKRTSQQQAIPLPR